MRTLTTFIVAATFATVSSSARADCTKDSDCKGARICEAGRCVSSAPPASLPPPPPPPPAGYAPVVPSAMPPPPPYPDGPAPVLIMKRHHSTGMMITGVVLTSFAALQLLAGSTMFSVDSSNGGDGTGTNTPSGLGIAGAGLILSSVVFAAIGIPLWVVGAKGDAVPVAALPRPGFGMIPASIGSGPDGEDSESDVELLSARTALTHLSWASPFVFALALSTTGCAVRSVNVVTRAPPDAFVGQRAFAILPVEFGGLQIGDVSEAQYLSGRDPSQQASFAADKVALAGEFVGSLRATLLAAGVDVVPATGPTAAQFTIRTSVGFIEPGAFMFVAERPSRVDLRVRILSASGAVVEEVTLTHGTDAITWAEIASGTRLRKDGAALGEMMGTYLLTRVGAAPGQPSAVVAPPPAPAPHRRPRQLRLWWHQTRRALHRGP